MGGSHINKIMSNNEIVQVMERKSYINIKPLQEVQSYKTEKRTKNS